MSVVHLSRQVFIQAVVLFSLHQGALAVDCNNNGIEDTKDIAAGTSPDCQPNGVPDECDIATLSSDLNFNEAPDECDTAPGIGDDLCWRGRDYRFPCASNADCEANETCGNKSRYISFTLGDQSLFGGAASIQVEIVTMKECAGGVNHGRGCDRPLHCPGSTCVDSPRIGDIWWAGAERSLPDTPYSPLRGALVECMATPHAQTWTAGVLHLYGPAIVPQSTYQVRMCDSNGENCSAPRLVATGKWGDVIRGFGGGANPDLTDINAVVHFFMGIYYSAQLNSFPRCDLVGAGYQGYPNKVNHVVNFADVSADISAFGGFPFPFTVPACSP